MKVKVNRLLNAGKYTVNFEVSDFTPEELAKMASFGIPMIDLRWIVTQNTPWVGKVALNQINKTYTMAFSTSEEATEYERGVLAQIKLEVERLRAAKDDFTSIDEVDLS